LLRRTGWNVRKASGGNGKIFYSLKEVQVLAERWRIYYNTIRPHSSLDYRSPAPETWHHEIKTGYGEMESKLRFRLPHTLALHHRNCFVHS
jgi:putative transposase